MVACPGASVGGWGMWDRWMDVACGKHDRVAEKSAKGGRSVACLFLVLVFMFLFRIFFYLSFNIYGVCVGGVHCVVACCMCPTQSQFNEITAWRLVVHVPRLIRRTDLLAI